MKEEKKGVFLRWPWNVVVYVVLVIALRLFAIPIILILMGVQWKNNPHGAAEGYCLSRTRKKLSWVGWGLLCLVIAVVLFVTFYWGLQQDPAYRETMDYVTLVVTGGGGLLLLLLGVYMIYAGVRDTFFPEKSILAQTIRSQLPYPDEAPPVDQLFAMVDDDLKANGQWFGAVGIGREWVLGDAVNRIDRLRGIFIVDKVIHRRAGKRNITERVLQLELIDDRWQKHTTDFKDPQDLRTAADCLGLRVPEARRGVNDQIDHFWTTDESKREEFERDFRQRQNRRASEYAQREFVHGGDQDFILKRRSGEVTSRVSAAMVEKALDDCLSWEETGFELTPTRPIEAQGRTFRALHCFAQTETQVLFVLELGDNTALDRVLERQEAMRALTAWLRREAPDHTGWEARQMDQPTKAAQPQTRKNYAKLSLVYASGAAENHTTFTEEDIQVAAEGIVDGAYQLVDLTHPEGDLWIRVTAGDKLDGRCTVEAAKPGGPELEFYTAKMSPREAAAWLTGYPHGEYMPGGRDWKRINKNKIK